MAYKVLIPQDVAQPGKDFLREHGYEIKMGSGITTEAIARDVADCDAILARTAPYPAAVIEAGKKLRVISRHGVGCDNIDVARAAELGIWVTFAPESNANTVAEHAVGCVMALARNLPAARPQDPGGPVGRARHPARLRPRGQGARHRRPRQDRAPRGQEGRSRPRDEGRRLRPVSDARADGRVRDPGRVNRRGLQRLGFRDPAHPGRTRQQGARSARSSSA